MIDENDVLDTFKDDEFAYKEHIGGQHQTFQENCYECHRENRLIEAKKKVAWSTYPPGVNPSTYPNEL